MKSITLLPTRIQDAILARMDRITFRAAKLPTLTDAVLWTDATSRNSEREAFRTIGKLTSLFLTTQVVNSNQGLRHSEHRALVIEGLMSASTCARILLAIGWYENIAGAPWYGMTAPEVGDAFQVYLGAYAASPKGSMLQLRTWFLYTFEILAEAAARAVRAKHTRRPEKPTRLDRVQVSEQLPSVKKPKITTILQVRKKGLSEITNTASSSAVVDSSMNKTIAGVKRAAEGDRASGRQVVCDVYFKGVWILMSTDIDGATTKAIPTTGGQLTVRAHLTSRGTRSLERAPPPASPLPQFPVAGPATVPAGDSGSTQTVTTPPRGRTGSSWSSPIVLSP
ncbi:hypothetical protein DFH09DRAFT_1495791 [Mycena vulgaris]|nr:hypothetical protein DFH09DRAFT_1495791 [Mycena vulgaris]